MSVEDIKMKTQKVKKTIENMMKDKNYKNKQKFLDWKCKYSEQLHYCCGDLSVCKNNFSMIIFDVVKKINQGEDELRNVDLQKKELENAAIGYMIADDAEYILNSISNYDAINYAYDSLNMAERRLKGDIPSKKHWLFGKKPERESVSSILENEKIESERYKIYQAIEDDLLTHGSIEKALKDYRAKKKKELETKRIRPERTESADNVSAEPETSYETKEERDERVNIEKSMQYHNTPPKI